MQRGIAEVCSLIFNRQDYFLPARFQLLSTSLLCIQGRGGKGSIFIFAAGNGREEFDTCAADGFVSSIYTISVGSVSVSGDQSFYDERCSGKLITVFTDDDFVDGQDVVSGRVSAK